VVDDDRDVQELVSTVLRSEGYEVECAGNGEEALRKIDTGKPELVVLDLMMPVMDGWTVLERLRTRGAARPVVVVLSAYAERSRALTAGAADFIVKPFSITELTASCRRALGC